VSPRILIFAGPNGAGKTTFAREYLPHEAGCPVFINADGKTVLLEWGSL
jgi:predicted ABC-type ATPase